MATAELDMLVRMLARLPGIGTRSAQRLALHLLSHRDSVMLPLARLIQEAAERIHACTICGNLDNQSPCHICQSETRRKDMICVVEQVGDLWALHRSHVYQGQYHVLGGVLSAVQNKSPSDLNIDQLITRAAQPEVTEVILALNATLDGQTTSHYLIDKLSDCQVKITMPAQGLPMGGELNFLDEGTLAAALTARHDVKSGK